MMQAKQENAVVREDSEGEEEESKGGAMDP